LDLLTTKCILNRVAYLTQEQQLKTRKSVSVSNEENFALSSTANAEPSIKTECLRVDMSAVTSFRTSSQEDALLIEESSRNSGEHFFYFSYIILYGSMSLSLLMKTSLQVIDTNYLSTLTRNVISYHLIELEAIFSKISTTLLSNPGQQMNTMKTCNDIRLPGKDKEEPSYHFIHYDECNWIAQGESLSATDSEFISNMSHIRNAACFDSELSTMILQNDHSGIYFRRVFEKEIFFQPRNPNPHDLFMDYIEQTVQNSLRNDFGIHTL